MRPRVTEQPARWSEGLPFLEFQDLPGPEGAAKPSHQAPFPPGWGPFGDVAMPAWHKADSIPPSPFPPGPPSSVRCSAPSVAFRPSELSLHKPNRK
ncbi:Hypothetical protein NTJ_06774 [Nesidiocoris tenuis]|uniref:Uncharacterized protein n=1 Tax=Nesidiocoris tenuis TaxID=355587 RepID=A0ABN7AP23_9HEMI|nr:Hypothetical protein NTJ_06774 [Nesidiocoris tenuis]